MDYALTATGEHEGKPLLTLSPTPDQDHPDTMNQIIWSLMDLLNAQGIEGVPFDKENPVSYNRVRLAITQMIAAAAANKATIAQVRQGTNDTLFVTPLGAVAAAGNYSQYVSVPTTPFSVLTSHMGGLLIASASASALTMPAANSVVLRDGAAFTFVNVRTDANVTISRGSGSDTILNAASNSAVVLRPGQQVTLVKIANGVWAALGDQANNAPFQKEWAGAWTAYQSNPNESGFIYSNYEFAHTLGVVPKMTVMEMTRLAYNSPTHGWASGDTIELPMHQVANPSTGVMGYATKKTAAKIYISFDTNHGLLLKEWNNTGQFRPDNVTWLWRFKAYA